MAVVISSSIPKKKSCLRYGHLRMAGFPCRPYTGTSVRALVQRDRAQEENMKPFSIVGIVLIALGIFALAYQGITYTKRERVVDVGPIHATKDTTKTIPLPPVLGGLALVGGVALLVAGAKRSG